MNPPVALILAILAIPAFLWAMSLLSYSRLPLGFRIGVGGTTFAPSAGFVLSGFNGAFSGLVFSVVAFAIALVLVMWKARV